jgi:serine/threonine-protein phosphatase 5
MAVELKNKGNKAFTSGDYIGAVDFYSQAIDLNDKEPTFFTNRAQVRNYSYS